MDFDPRWSDDPRDRDDYGLRAEAFAAVDSANRANQTSLKFPDAVCADAEQRRRRRRKTSPMNGRGCRRSRSAGPGTAAFAAVG